MDEFMNEFMQAMKEVFPKLLVQFEDFSTDNAFKYLEVFRNSYRVFNDDVNALSSHIDILLIHFLDPRHRCRYFVWFHKRSSSRIGCI